MNPMREIKIEKVTLNLGCGDDKDKIERATKLLAMLSESKPVVTKSKRRNTFNIPKGKPLGVMVTMRGKKAEELFRKVLQANDNKVKASQFDKDGNFNIGVKEYIDLPGIKYNYEVGMLGLNVSVTVKRAGYGIKDRRVHKGKISKKHKINKEESIEWIKKAFNVEVA